jgi:hypothetical protein
MIGEHRTLLRRYVGAREPRQDASAKTNRADVLGSWSWQPAAQDEARRNRVDVDLQMADEHVARIWPIVVRRMFSYLNTPTKTKFDTDFKTGLKKFHEISEYYGFCDWDFGGNDEANF